MVAADDVEESFLSDFFSFLDSDDFSFFDSDDLLKIKFEMILLVLIFKSAYLSNS